MLAWHVWTGGVHWLFSTYVIADFGISHLFSCWMVYRVTTHLEKSGNSKMVREMSGKMEKVRGSEIRCVFSSSKYSKTRLQPGLRPWPHWGSLRRSPRLPSRLGRGHPIPFPQLLQPQLLNSWLSGLTLFFINMKQRLLTISVNTRYRVIFVCLYWKSQGISCGLESGHPGSNLFAVNWPLSTELITELHIV